MQIIESSIARWRDQNELSIFLNAPRRGQGDTNGVTGTTLMTMIEQQSRDNPLVNCHQPPPIPAPLQVAHHGRRKTFGHATRLYKLLNLLGQEAGNDTAPTSERRSSFRIQASLSTIPHLLLQVASQPCLFLLHRSPKKSIFCGFVALSSQGGGGGGSGCSLLSQTNAMQRK